MIAMTEILCDRCHKQIRYKEDLTTTTHLLPYIKKYHNACYAEQEKEAFLLGEFPINTQPGTLGTIIGVGILVYFIPYAYSLGVYERLTSIGQYWSFVYLLMLLLFLFPFLGIIYLLYVRLGSYYKYEKALPSKTKK